MQTNGRANMTDPIYGDWGKNGKYGGQASVQIAYHDVARAILAESQSAISGYSGLIPATVKSEQTISSNITIEGALTALANPLNGKVVCILLDAITGRAINADVCNLTDADPNSIEEMAETPVLMTTQQGSIIIAATKARIALYTSEGLLLDKTNVCGSATLNTNGYQGVAIIHLLCDGQAEVRKLLVK